MSEGGRGGIVGTARDRGRQAATCDLEERHVGKKSQRKRRKRPCLKRSNNNREGGCSILVSCQEA